MDLMPVTNIFAMTAKRRPLWESLETSLLPADIQRILTDRSAEVTIAGEVYTVRKGGTLDARGNPESVMLSNAQTNIAEHTKDDIDGYYRRLTIQSGRRVTERREIPTSTPLEEIKIPKWLQPRLTIQEQGLIARRGYCWDIIK